jgi:hypothetical protein
VKLMDLLYRIEGEVQGDMTVADVPVLIVTEDGARYEPTQASMSGDALVIYVKANEQ